MEPIICPQCQADTVVYYSMEVAPGDFDEDVYCETCGWDPYKKPEPVPAMTSAPGDDVSFYDYPPF